MAKKDPFKSMYLGVAAPGSYTESVTRQRAASVSSTLNTGSPQQITISPIERPTPVTEAQSGNTIPAGSYGTAFGSAAPFFETAQSMANAAAQKATAGIAGVTGQYEAIANAYGARTQELSGLLSGWGESQKQALAERYEQQKAAKQQELINRGLTSSTALDAAMRGLSLDYEKSLRELEEQLTREKMGYLTQLTGEELQARQLVPQSVMNTTEAAFGYEMEPSKMSERIGGAAVAQNLAKAQLEQQKALQEATLAQQRAMQEAGFQQESAMQRAQFEQQMKMLQAQGGLIGTGMTSGGVGTVLGGGGVGGMSRSRSVGGGGGGGILGGGSDMINYPGIYPGFAPYQSAYQSALINTYYPPQESAGKPWAKNKAGGQPSVAPAMTLNEYIESTGAKTNREIDQAIKDFFNASGTTYSRLMGQS